MGRLAVVAVAVALLATACGERGEPTGAAAPLYPVTVQTGTDRPLVVRAAARRIAVIGAGPRQIIVALGAAPQIVGQPVDGNGDIRLRLLARLKPDLIVATASTSDRQLSKAAQSTHAQVYQAHGDSIRDVERSITDLGHFTNKPVQARELVRAIEAKGHTVAKALRHVPVASVFVDTGFFTTVSDQSLAGDLIREAHGRNVAGSSPGSGPFDLTQLIQADPDVYLLTSDSGTAPADLKKDARTRKLKAVIQGRVYLIDSGLLRPGPLVGQALLEIARLLHPDAIR